MADSQAQQHTLIAWFKHPWPMARTVGGQSDLAQWAIFPATVFGSLLRDTCKQQEQSEVCHIIDATDLAEKAKLTLINSCVSKSLGRLHAKITSASMQGRWQGRAERTWPWPERSVDANSERFWGKSQMQRHSVYACTKLRANVACEDRYKAVTKPVWRELADRPERTCHHGEEEVLLAWSRPGACWTGVIDRACPVGPSTRTLELGKCSRWCRETCQVGAAGQRRACWSSSAQRAALRTAAPASVTCQDNLWRGRWALWAMLEWNARSRCNARNWEFESHSTLCIFCRGPGVFGNHAFQMCFKLKASPDARGNVCNIVPTSPNRLKIGLHKSLNVLHCWMHMHAHGAECYKSECKAMLYANSMTFCIYMCHS